MGFETGYLSVIFVTFACLTPCLLLGTIECGFAPAIITFFDEVVEFEHLYASTLSRGLAAYRHFDPQFTGLDAGALGL
jgi:hypothetical protein